MLLYNWLLKKIKKEKAPISYDYNGINGEDYPSTHMQEDIHSDEDDLVGSNSSDRTRP